MTNVVSLLTENLPLKLLALLLGLVVYAHVYTEQEQVSLLRVPLTVTGLPPTLVLNETPPEFVEVSARGKGKQVLKLKVQQPEIIVSLSEVNPGRLQRLLSPADVVLPVGSEVSISHIVDPEMVIFFVDTLITRQMAVHVRLVGELPQGYALLGPVVSDPPYVMVRGARSRLDEMTRVATAPIDLSRIHGTTEEEVELGPDLSGLDFPSSVAVTVPVMELVTRNLSAVPVKLSGLAPGFAAWLDPDTAWVSISGPELLLDSPALDTLNVVLNATGMGAGRHLLSPQVDLPHPENMRLLSVHPARFIVEIGSRPR